MNGRRLRRIDTVNPVSKLGDGVRLDAKTQSAQRELRSGAVERIPGRLWHSSGQVTTDGR